MKNFFTFKNCTNSGIFLAIIVGLFFPASSFLKKLIPILLAGMLFFSFLKLEIRLHKFLRKELLLYPLIALLIYPLIIYVATLPLDTEYRIGFIIITIAPTAIGAPVVVNFIKGDHELIISQVLLSNVLAPLSYTLLLFIFFNSESISIPVVFIVRKITLLIILPLCAALIVRKNTELTGKCVSFAKYSNPLLFILIIGIATASASSHLRQISLSLLLQLMLLSAGLAIALFGAGFLLTSTLKVKKTAAIMLGHKNTALSIWIGVSNFNAVVILPIVLYIIFHHTINALLIHLYYSPQE